MRATSSLIGTAFTVGWIIGIVLTAVAVEWGWPGWATFLVALAVFIGVHWALYRIGVRIQRGRDR